MLKKVLVVEDDRSIKNLMEFLLKSEGFEVISTNRGEEAFDLAKARRPDLVLLDVMMGSSDGYEICRSIKKDGEIGKTPVIFVSARCQSKEIEEGKKAGCAAYISKPFDPEELLRILKSYL